MELQVISLTQAPRLSQGRAGKGSCPLGCSQPAWVKKRAGASLAEKVMLLLYQSLLDASPVQQIRAGLVSRLVTSQPGGFAQCPPKPASSSTD